MKAASILLLLFLSTQLTGQPCREVVAFFPSWKWYNRSRLVNPSTIDYSKYTVINYAFFQPQADGQITLFDPYADKVLLLGEFKPNIDSRYKKSHEIQPQNHLSNTSLVSQAHKHGVKVLISIGGWTLSENFSVIAADPIKRRTFAKNCAEIVETFQVDGIDIDWEYPGYKPQKGQARDRENFTLLVKEVRKVFDLLEKQGHTPLLLSADFGAGISHMDMIEWDQVSPLLDHINLMTYDFYGNNPSRTNHHAPLFAPRKGINGFDLDSSVRHLIERHRVPPEKINIGLAFFGRSLKTRGKADIHVVSHRTPDTQTFAEDNGAPAYYNILAAQHKFNYHWDNFAEAPYLQGKKIKTFVTFDDEKSIRRKGHYILQNNLGGALVWDITSDYIENKTIPGTIESTPLADALSEALCELDEQPSPAIAIAAPPSQLPQQWSPLSRRTFAPRLTGEPVMSKKEKRKWKRKRKKLLRKGFSRRYFDRSW